MDRVSAALVVLPALRCMYLVMFRDKTAADFEYLLVYGGAAGANALLAGGLAAIDEVPALAVLLLSFQVGIYIALSLWEWRRRQKRLAARPHAAS